MCRTRQEADELGSDRTQPVDVDQLVLQPSEPTVDGVQLPESDLGVPAVGRVGARRPSTPPRHPFYTEHYQRTAARLGRQRGRKVARVELARKLGEAIWHMLTKNEPFAPARSHVVAGRTTTLN